MATGFGELKRDGDGARDSETRRASSAGVWIAAMYSGTPGYFCDALGALGGDGVDEMGCAGVATTSGCTAGFCEIDVGSDWTAGALRRCATLHASLDTAGTKAPCVGRELLEAVASATRKENAPCIGRGLAGMRSGDGGGVEKAPCIYRELVEAAASGTRKENTPCIGRGEVEADTRRGRKRK
jgi:hypothetical protein